MLVADLGDIRLHYTDSGPRGAPAVVFANSLGTDLRVWDRIVARLPESWGILRQDKRGHGLSAAKDTLSIETMADDVETLLDHYDIGGFTGVGLSVGGLIMQRLAARTEHARDTVA